MAAKDKNIWILLIFILSGLVVGGLIGEISKGVSFLTWLSYGQNFGLTSPLILDINILSITFGCMFKINIASIIGLAISVLIYKKI